MDILSDPKVANLPPLYSQEHVEDPVILVRIWHPCSDWYHYPYEFDPEQGLFFGWVKGFEGELGYFSVAEFKDVEDGTGIPFQVDETFQPMPLSEVRKLPNRDMPDGGITIF